MSKATILVVEDERQLLKDVGAHLDSLGYTTMLANDGREAMILAQQTPPDLVVTDIVMPYSSGLELIGFVKSTLQVPVIVLSSIDEEDTVMIAFRLGADDFLTKPFQQTELTLRVRRLLNH